MNNTPARQRRKEQYDTDLEILYCCAYCIMYSKSEDDLATSPCVTHNTTCVKGLSTTVLLYYDVIPKISVNILSVEIRLNNLVDYLHDDPLHCHVPMMTWSHPSGTFSCCILSRKKVYVTLVLIGNLGN